MKFYSHYFDLLNTNRRIIFISVCGNLNLYIISFFKVISIYFTKVANISFVK